MSLLRTLITGVLVRPSRFVRLLALLVVSVLIALLFYLGQKPVSVGLLQPPFDKLMHFAFYGGLAALFWVVSGARSVTLVLASVGLVGFLDEYAQQFNPGRVASFGDWIADMVGAAVMIAIILTLRWLAERGRPRFVEAAADQTPA